jgi:hypothetical protein
MKRFHVTAILTFALIITGCAVGNKYDYRNASVSLPVKGDSEVTLGIIDNRSYVLSGNKKSNFIGLQRGGFNNPFDVTTSSGQPLADDMFIALSRALSDNGFTVAKLYFSSPDSSIIATAIKDKGMAKNVVLTVTEWKTDVFMNVTLHYDLLLQVVAKDGNTVASNQVQGQEKIGGGGFEGQNSRAAAAAFETKIGRLFNNPEVIESLKN